MHKSITCLAAAVPLVLASGCLDIETTPIETESASLDVIPACPGIASSGIDSFDGFAGYYLRFAPYGDGELVTLNVTTAEPRPDWIGVDGSYQAVVRHGALYALETGRYLGVPNNPALGPMLALDVAGDGDFDDYYYVLGSTRDAKARVSKLCLSRAGEDGSGAPFAMARLGW